jgi:hypothetical protein
LHYENHSSFYDFYGGMQPPLAHGCNSISHHSVPWLCNHLLLFGPTSQKDKTPSYLLIIKIRLQIQSLQSLGKAVSSYASPCVKGQFLPQDSTKDVLNTYIFPYQKMAFNEHLHQKTV